MKCEKLYPWGFRPVGVMRTPYITPHLSRRAGTEFRMSCEVCLYGAYSNCPCCSPEDDGEPSSCGGEGRAADCEGCEDCIVEVRRTSYHTARREHHGLLVGDKYARTVGFDYQVGGGPRTYVRPVVRRVARGPNHPAVLVETGVLSPVAQERAALTARFREVDGKVNDAYYRKMSIEEAETLLTLARTVFAEVDAFVALHDANNTLRLRAVMAPRSDTVWRAEQVVAHFKRRW